MPSAKKLALLKKKSAKWQESNFFHYENVIDIMYNVFFRQSVFTILIRYEKIVMQIKVLLTSQNIFRSLKKCFENENKFWVVFFRIF